MAAIRPQANIEPRCNLANFGTCRKEQALQDAARQQDPGVLPSSTGSPLSACIATVQYSAASIVLVLLLVVVLACNVDCKIEL